MRAALLAAALVACARLAMAGGVLPIDDFEEGLQPNWEVKEFRGTTRYTVVSEGTNRVLRGESRGTASGLVFPIDVDPREYPVLAWRWKVDHILQAGDATTRAGDDYPARLYVVFPHWFPPKTRILNYIWANRLPQGTHVTSPFLSSAVMFAVESGDGRTGVWIEERRDVVADFRLAFGEDPPRIGAVAIMTDTDQTGETAVGFYDDIRFEQPTTGPNDPPPTAEGAK